MTNRGDKMKTSIFLTVAAVMLLALFPGAAAADGPANEEAFIAAVSNGYGGEPVGVFASGELALRIVQQPPNDPVFVSARPGYATQFGLASSFGSVGLLAHDDLSGSLFFKLTVGQKVDLIYGSGSVRHYAVSIIRRARALDPANPYSDLIDLDSQFRVSSTQLDKQVYGVPGRLVLQTCISANGIDSWGRLFVLADPIP